MEKGIYVFEGLYVNVDITYSTVKPITHNVNSTY